MAWLLCHDRVLGLQRSTVARCGDPVDLAPGFSVYRRHSPNACILHIFPLLLLLWPRRRPRILPPLRVLRIRRRSSSSGCRLRRAPLLHQLHRALLPLDATSTASLLNTLHSSTTTSGAQGAVYTHTTSSQTIQTILLSPEILFKLVFLTVLSLAPILGRERLRAFVEGRTSSSSSAPGDEMDAEKEEGSTGGDVQESPSASAGGNACIANANVGACISNARRELGAGVNGGGGSPNGLGNGHVKKRGRHYKRFSSFSMPHFPNLPTLNLPHLPHLPHMPNLPHLSHSVNSGVAELPQTSATVPGGEGEGVRSWRAHLRATLSSVGGAMESVGGAIGGVGAGVAEVVGGPEWRRRERERELEVLVREKRDMEREV
ncbi:hypothetical protein PTI98_005105 [Pleurotus ostreatus]|nr:hypothetical protein PTI98_005105 [Pleurotus ostreatus]